MELTSHHKNSYGSWAGNERGHLPDPSRCAAEVCSPGSMIFHQCSFKRGYGPEEAYCKIHDPVRIAEKRKIADEAYERKRWKSFTEPDYLRRIGSLSVKFFLQQASMEEVESMVNKYLAEKEKQE